MLSRRDHLAVFSDNMKMKKYLPVLKKADGPCGLISTDQLSEKEYERRIEYSKIIAVDQAKWDLPMPIESSESRWSDYSHNDVLNIHVLDFLVNLDRDASHYTKRVIENEYVRQKYTVVDCRNSESQPSICESFVALIGQHEEL